MHFSNWSAIVPWCPSVFVPMCLRNKACSQDPAWRAKATYFGKKHLCLKNGDDTMQGC